MNKSEPEVESVRARMKGIKTQDDTQEVPIPPKSFPKAYLFNEVLSSGTHYELRYYRKSEVDSYIAELRQKIQEEIHRLFEEKIHNSIISLKEAENDQITISELRWVLSLLPSIEKGSRETVGCSQGEAQKK